MTLTVRPEDIAGNDIPDFTHFAIELEFEADEVTHVGSIPIYMLEDEPTREINLYLLAMEQPRVARYFGLNTINRGVQW